MEISELTPGTTFAGEFRIIGRLAAGGMGAVYTAEQISTGRQRALKVMLPNLVGSQELRDKFMLEARVGGKIQSEHVVEVVAAGVDAASGSPWLAMELLQGEDLASAIKQRGRYSPREMAEILAQVCHAVGAAHAAGIVHRDLKPENIFLAQAKRASSTGSLATTVKVLDFGIAKVLEAARGSNTGAIGSPLWMAPEQTERNAEIAPATDVWALGLIVFTMLTGKSFWHAADASEMALSAFLRELVLDPIPKATARAAELGMPDAIPAALDDWFAHTITREREERFSDASAAYRALRGVVEGAPSVPNLPAFVAPSTSTTDPKGIRIKSGADASSQTATDRLGIARTLPHVTAAAAADDHDDHESVVPVQGASPKLFAIGGIVVAVAVIGGAIVMMRSRDGGKGTEIADAGMASNLPFCPKGMVRIAGGDLMMGSADGPKEEQPAHKVHVDAFCMDVTEVTVKDYRECADKKACNGGRTTVEWPSITKEDRATWSAFCNEGKAARDEHPMNCISFEDAAAYCSFAGKKLPTEEQWEYAARGGDGRAYPWGNDSPTAARVNGCDDGCAKAAKHAGDSLVARLAGDDHWEATSPTGAFPEGEGPFGNFDLSGNVAEWVDAAYCNYGQTSCGTSARVIRGGAWTTDVGVAMKATSRAKANPATRMADVGVRCAK